MNISSAHPGLSAVHVQDMVWQMWTKQGQGVVGNNRVNIEKGMVGTGYTWEKGWWSTVSAWARGESLLVSTQKGCQRNG